MQGVFQCTHFTFKILKIVLTVCFFQIKFVFFNIIVASLAADPYINFVVKVNEYALIFKIQFAFRE